MKYLLLIALMFKGLLACCQAGAPAPVQNRLVLIGNTGRGQSHAQAILNALKTTLPAGSATSILFLGDNAPLAAEPGRGSLLFIPGEKEWNDAQRGGWDSLLQEQKRLQETYDNKNVLLPKNGCPGPELVKLGKDAVLVLLNTQWWLEQYEKPGIESDCPTRSKVQVYEELDRILRENQDKLVIVAGHHPLMSKGLKGNHFSVKQHIFPLTDWHHSLYLPLPVIGSLYPIISNAFPSSQELKHPVYQSMVNDLEKVLASHPHVLYVSAHEQNLQLLQAHGLTYLVSGAGGTTRRVSRGRGTQFANDRPGFVVVEVSVDKKADVLFYTLQGDRALLTYKQTAIDFSSRPPLPDTVTPYVAAPLADSITVAASRQYETSSKTRTFLLGHNYRAVWSMPVTLPVFHLEHEKGGYSIRKAGGGKQTKSLHLEDSSGHNYKLRTIDKDPKEFLPPEFRSTLTQAIVNDLISAAHPYAPLVVADLAARVGVVEARPTYYFVPNDSAFGYYRPQFANKVVMLVDKDPAPFDNTKGSYDIINKITEKADHRVDQQSVLRARLLDILVGDFDRHMGQWSWGSVDTGKGKLYVPVPTDRDQAFFLSDGKLVQLAARKNLSLFHGFSAQIDNVKGLGFSAEEFDRTFLTSLDEKQWKEVIRAFQAALPDTAIDNAVRKLPPEIYALDGKEIATKLKSRRDDLLAEGLKYYRFLSDNVNVLGSNQSDYFLLTQQGGAMQVQVFERKDGDTVMHTYTRVFDPQITREVRLYGLNGDDCFKVDSLVDKSVRVRLIGGAGKDTFNVEGSGDIYIYDQRSEGNSLQGGTHIHNKISDAPGVNDYDLNSYAFKDKGGFPKLSLAANSEYGPIIGVGWLKTTYSFRREPFSTSNALVASYAPWRNSYQLRYQGVFNNLFNVAGLAVDAVVHDQAVMNFFGLGNDTKRDREYPFYRIRYSYAAADLLLNRNRFGRLNLAIGPSIYHYWNHNQNNDGKILAQPGLIGLDSASVYHNKAFIGGKFRMDVNALPNLQFPTQGMLWQNELSYLRHVRQGRSFTVFKSDLILAAPLTDTSRLVALIRLGGGHIFNKSFEYFQAVGLDNGNNLRGFRNNRFLGRSSVYGSLELRFKLGQVHSISVPGSLGVLGFGDMGRVWIEDIKSQTWHTAFGGGLYFFPFNHLLISATAGHNEDGMIYNFTIGSSINWHQ